MKIDLQKNEDLNVKLGDSHRIKIETSGKVYTLYFWRNDKTAIAIDDGDLHYINSDTDFKICEEFNNFDPEIAKKILNHGIEKVREIKKFMDENGIKIEPNIVDGDIISYDFVTKNDNLYPYIENGKLINFGIKDVDVITKAGIPIEYLVGNDEFLTSPECDEAFNKMVKDIPNKRPAKIKIKKCSTFDDWYRTYTGQSFVVESYIEDEGFWVNRKNYKTTYFVNVNDAEILEWK